MINSLGNPQLGYATSGRGLPSVYDDPGGRLLYRLCYCPWCGGYFAAYCPCGADARLKMRIAEAEKQYVRWSVAGLLQKLWILVTDGKPVTAHRLLVMREDLALRQANARAHYEEFMQQVHEYVIVFRALGHGPFEKGT